MDKQNENLRIENMRYAEEVMNKHNEATKDMTKEEKQQYVNSLSEEEKTEMQNAAIYIKAQMRFGGKK